MRQILVYLKAYKKEAVLAPLFKLLEAFFELFVPLVMASLIDVGIAGKDRAYILKMGAILVVLAVVGLTAAVTAQFFAAKAAVGFSTKLREVLFGHIQNLNFTNIDQVGTSTMITRMTSDINQVQSGVNMVLRLFLRSPIIVFGAMIMAFTIDAKCALVFVLTIPVLAAVVFGIMLVTIPLYRKVQNGLDQVLGRTRQNLTGVRVIRAFGQEGAQTAQFQEENKALTMLQLYVARISACMNPVTYVIVNAALLVLIYMGALRVNIGGLTQGEVIAILNYMSQILVELVKLANLIILMTKAAACGDRIAAVLAIQNEEVHTDDLPASDAAKDAYLVFDKVSLTYKDGGESTLSGIDFRVEKGDTVGIIGGTGSGKSSLINVLAGFYPVTEGAIYLEGENILSLSEAERRKRIGMVPQKAVLFQGTIRSNLLWGKEDATQEEMWAALELAQAKEVVEGKEGKLDAIVEQKGRNFSGGQRQRLTIARALIQKPEILVLDDSASALDFATDASLRAAIKSLGRSMTTFIISQRASSIRYADKIIVLDDGQMVGCGTHEELLSDCAVYQEIYYSQYPEERKEGMAQ